MDREQWRWEFGDRLRLAREARGMTQGMLAADIGVHKNVLGDYERGVHEPTVYVMAKIAVALGVSADELLGVKQ